MTMTNVESREKINQNKSPLLQGHMPIVMGGAILILGSGLIGYTVGHRQGLTVSGYDADAEQLVEVVNVQKQRLEESNATLNAAIQERDISISNVNDLTTRYTQAIADKEQAETAGIIYREALRQRGGLGLMIQNIGIKPLPDNAYEYQIDLVQVSPSKRAASGTVEIRLVRGSEVLVVPMEDNQFNFDNLAKLTGRWTMPKGFTPQYVEVQLKGSIPVTRRFAWSFGKPVDVESSFVNEIPQVQANTQ